jgi:acyl-CoA synthetase (AMP-forming)/AMP-acid ligase II
MGGEVADQAVLDSLRSTFPDARLVHIYATTELGRCFSVADGLAGFPARFLDRASPDGVEMRISADGELLVRSANAMQGYDGAATGQAAATSWIATGDMVSLDGGRVRFVGRRSEIINVAGNKVHPLEIEREVKRVAGVRDARVYGKRSSMAGQIVACDLVVEAQADQERVRDEVMRHCARTMAPFQRPRLVTLVPEIALSSAGKTLRRDGA